tara:strand:+ start:377 stop:676 length:300 start_codon:yes stop_codon:yes gene_type:complete
MNWPSGHVLMRGSTTTWTELPPTKGGVVTVFPDVCFDTAGSFEHVPSSAEYKHRDIGFGVGSPEPGFTVYGIMVARWWHSVSSTFVGVEVQGFAASFPN